MPKPRKGESKKDFISRCMGDDEANKDFPDRDQRFAVCQSIFKEKKMNRLQTYRLKIQMSQLVRNSVFNGEEHFVIPAVIIVEGVMNGVLYRNAELKKAPQAWNGVPVMNGHPVDSKGEFVSANSPEVTEQSIGQLFNTKLVNNKLKTEIWINIEKTKEIAPQIISKLEDNQVLELSTGLLLEPIKENGIFEGVAFNEIATEMIPDHLALLPDDTGACGVEDGCGFPRVNQKCDCKKPCACDVVFNLEHASIGHEELFFKLDDLIRASVKLNDNEWIHIVEVFDKFVIYEVTSNDEARKMFKINYVIDADGVVSLSGDAIEVIKQITFKKIESTATNTKTAVNKPGNEGNKQGGPNMDREAKVNALITDGGWSEESREALTGMSDEIFDRVDHLTSNQKTEEDDESKGGNETTETNTQKQKPAEGKKTVANSQEANEEEEEEEESQPVTIADWLEDSDVPSEVKEVINESLSIRDRDRGILVTNLMKNTRNTFTEDQLKVKSTEELKAIAKLANVKVNFKGRGFNEGKQEDANAIPPMPKINWKKEKETAGV